MKFDIELCKLLEQAEAFDLRSAMEHAIVSFPDRGMAFEEIAGGTVAYAGPGSFFNQALGAGLECTVTDDALNRIVDFFHSRGEPARVEVSPLADRELASKLSRRGFAIDDYENVLAADLLRISGKRDPRVEVCRDPETWANISGHSFSEGAGPSEALRFTSLIMATHPTVTPLALCENGRIVSTACLDTEIDGTAGFFAASTTPEARGKGYHSALIGDRIARAKEIGATIARSSAKIGSTSERNFRRFGFTPVFTRTIWALKPPTA